MPCPKHIWYIFLIKLHFPSDVPFWYWDLKVLKDRRKQRVMITFPVPQQPRYRLFNRVPHICFRKQNTIVSDKGFSPGRHQTIIWTNARILLIESLGIGNKLQWNRKRNSYIFIKENTFENAVWEMAAILSRPQWVKIKKCFPPRGMISLTRTCSVSNHRRLDCLLNRLFRRRIQKTSKLRFPDPFWRESTGHRWIPLIKGQWCGKWFNLMTSSCAQCPSGRCYVYIHI